MAKVYVSSTRVDLAEYRDKVERVLRRMGHTDVAMEYYVAEEARPAERCLKDVAEADLYVGIFAWRYGHQPTEHNPENLSITELEYRRALEAGKTCLIFLLSEDAPWPRSLIQSAEKDPNNFIRSIAIIFLRKFLGKEQTYSLLQRLVIHDSEFGVRRTAVELLSEDFRDYPQTLSTLLNLAVTDDSPSLRWTIINAIGKHWPSHPETLKLLRERAENDSSLLLRKRAEQLGAELVKA